MIAKSWSELVDAYRSDQSPWLIVPDDPVESAAHRAVSRAELSEWVVRIASELRRRGVRTGDSVVIVADNDAECCALIIATIAAGFVAVPIAPKRGADQRTNRLEAVASDCAARLVVTSAAVLTGGYVETVPDHLQLCTFESLVASQGSVESIEDRSAIETALIQYTSGTTQRPRGVVLTHGNILSNLAGIDGRIGLKETDRALCWLPMFHDMGLIGTLLSSTWWRVPMVLMKTATFVHRPESWLWAVSRFSVASCAAPNAAYHLCATRLPEQRLHGLDLASWRFAFNGSELIHPATLGMFCERFGKYGFRPETMYPVYGLAENTVAGTLPIPGRPPRVEWIDRTRLARGEAVSTSTDGRGMVGVGTPIDGHELRIVDPSSSDVLGERLVGEIELRGPCVMRGYHAREELTRQALREGGWLRTGDLGYLAEGELFVVGRAKETIKCRGQSFFASDLASVVSQVDGVRRGAVAAFGVADVANGTEAIVIVAETRLAEATSRDELVRRIELGVQLELGVRPREVVLAEPNWVPKTSSGKVQHGVARARYLETHSS